MTRELSILQVSSADVSGGAEKVALDLHTAYLARGLDSWLAVGRREMDEPRVLQISNDELRSAWDRLFSAAAARGAGPGAIRWLAERVFLMLADPARYARIFSGREDYGYRGTARLLELPPSPVDVLHLHNIHSYYFDLRLLPQLSAAVPTIMTMHDAWLLTGHCAHPFACEKWRTGCGSCPDLGNFVPISRDASGRNLAEKRDIVRRSNLHLATPSRWLMRMVEESGLAGECAGTRVIPNGVDTSVFAPGDRHAARDALGLPQDRDLVLFAAHRLKDNPFKDYATLVAALRSVKSARAGAVTLVALGDTSSEMESEGVEVVTVPFVRDPREVARYYQAADLYVHPARAENLPLAVLEAMACGAPVIASEVGGIPEAVVDGETGRLVKVGDAAALASAIVSLIDDHARRDAFSEAGRRRIAERFTLARQADAYIDWYRELVAQRESQAPTRS